MKAAARLTMVAEATTAEEATTVATVPQDVSPAMPCGRVRGPTASMNVTKPGRTLPIIVPITQRITTRGHLVVAVVVAADHRVVVADHPKVAVAAVVIADLNSSFFIRCRVVSPEDKARLFLPSGGSLTST